MKLLLITQRVDEHDSNLASHIRWIETLASMTESVSVIAQSVGTYHLPNNVRVYSLGKECGAGKWKQLWNFWRISGKLIVQTDAALILMAPLYILLLAPLAWFHGKKLFLWFTHKSVTMTLRLAVACVTRVFSASRESFRLSTNKVLFTGHAIDTDFFSPAPDVRRETKKIITVGRVTPSKNLAMMIEVIAELKRHGLGFILQIIGLPVIDVDMAYEKSLHDQATRLGVQNQIHFLGVLSPTQVREEYRTARLFVNASATGSLDRAGLEAMACACPVLISNEAFKPILPIQAFVPYADVSSFVQAIEQEDRSSMRTDLLRNEVIEHHKLQHTLQTVINEIKKYAI